MKIFTLVTKVMNGTVTISTMTDNFSTLELAEKCMEKLKEINKDTNNLKIYYNIEESDLYTSESEIPILNNKTKNDN